MSYWNSGPDREEDLQHGDPSDYEDDDWNGETEEIASDDCMDCGQCDSCIERTKAFYEEMESEPHDVEVEREQIREANARNERYRQLAKLREEIEQFRAAYERAKKASGTNG